MTDPLVDAGGIAFVKGHGTQNDFILLPDPDDTLHVSAVAVRALCDRHVGLGADGVIRVVRTTDGSAPFRMDYRNADGSLAEMCGNGARLFARFLVDEGWAAPGQLTFATRGGPRTAWVPAHGDITVHLGPAVVGGSSVATMGSRALPGVRVDVGNPHLVCVTETDLAALDLDTPPGHDGSVFPDGVNVEFVRVLGPDHVAMRVHERGVGETRSCGTGTVAVAAAHLAAQQRGEGEIRVDVPGGSVRVRIEATDSALTGPAVVVATGRISADAWAAFDAWPGRGGRAAAPSGRPTSAAG